MIQQQIYTRERRGLFRQSEGYDSVAKSAGLDDAFIKDMLHPFCVYNASKALQTENAPESDYPKAQTVLRYADGRALLGQSVYKAYDFAGQRATFLTHNYILPNETAETLDISYALYNTRFITSYDPEQGRELPELETLPYVSETRAPVPPREALAMLDIGRECFVKIVSCLFLSVSGTKKLYIIPPVETKGITEYAKALLSVFYQYLPPSLTARLGFTTYNREPENKKGLHLIFLEKGAARPGDTRFTRDFLLDLTRPYKSNEPREDGAFCLYLWNVIERGGAINEFYDFTENFPAGELALSRYDALAELYAAYTNISGVSGCDAQQKQRLFSVLLEYLPQTAPLFRQEIYDLTLNLISGEAGAFDLFLTDRVNAAPLHSIFAEITFWRDNLRPVFDSARFTELIAGRYYDSVNAAQDKFTSARLAYQALGDFIKTGPPLGSMAFAIMDAIDAALLPCVDIDEITAEQLETLPTPFIKRGKDGENPELFIILEILKKAAAFIKQADDEPVQLRYFIGSYQLTKKAHLAIVKKLKELYTGAFTPSQFDNITFLFRGIDRLGLDAEGLFGYADDCAGGEKAAFLLWLVEKHVLNLQNDAHKDAARVFVKSNVKDGAFRETICANAELKAMVREARFGKLAGLM